AAVRRTALRRRRAAPGEPGLPGILHLLPAPHSRGLSRALGRQHPRRAGDNRGIIPQAVRHLPRPAVQRGPRPRDGDRRRYPHARGVYKKDGRKCNVRRPTSNPPNLTAPKLNCRLAAAYNLFYRRPTWRPDGMRVRLAGVLAAARRTVARTALRHTRLERR